MPTLTLSEILTFVHGQATEQDLEALGDAIHARRKALGAINAAKICVGNTVELAGLSPKYLNGLKGTISTSDGNRASVLLDEASTDKLRYAGRKFTVLASTTEYLLSGVPLSCCRIL